MNPESLQIIVNAHCQSIAYCVVFDDETPSPDPKKIEELNKLTRDFASQVNRVLDSSKKLPLARTEERSPGRLRRIAEAILPEVSDPLVQILDHKKLRLGNTALVLFLLTVAFEELISSAREEAYLWLLAAGAAVFLVLLGILVRALMHPGESAKKRFWGYSVGVLAGIAVLFMEFRELKRGGAEISAYQKDVQKQDINSRAYLAQVKAAIDFKDLKAATGGFLLDLDIRTTQLERKVYMPKLLTEFKWP